MELWQIWLLFVVPEIASFVNVISVIFTSIVAFALIGACVLLCLKRSKTRPDEGYINATKAFLKFLIPLYVIVCVVALLSSLVPTKSDIIKIVGGYYITNIENLDKLPPNAVKAANKFLDDYFKSEE